jgi:tetratricopeptide (TPR) repeat protein
MALVGGCGDPALWARWQAGREWFRAQAFESRVHARGTPSEADLDRVERRYRALLEKFPPETWAPATPGAGAAYEVATVSGRAGLALAACEANRGRHGVAEAELERLEPRVARLPGILLAARLARYDALVRLGRFDDALAERSAVAQMDPNGDPGLSEPPPDVLEAPLRLAAELRSRGREEDAGRVLREADARFTAALERAAPAARQAMALGLGSVRAARGDAAGALAPLRSQMLASDPGVRAEWAEVMAEYSMAAGAPDSALVYARWAMHADDTRRVAGQAMLVAAQAWEKLGRGDSALVAYDLALRRWQDPGVLGPVLRFRRAELLASLGKWELAASEYVTLAAKYPAHVLAMRSGQRIVAHHLEHGEPELARVAGEAALANLERLLGTNRDPDVQREARAARAGLLLDLGRLPEAEDALLDQWRRYPADSAAQEAGLRAANLARYRPGGTARAESILTALRRNAFSATVRREADAGALAPR